MEQNYQEPQLDRDFLFFLDSSKKFYPQIKDDEEVRLCNAWLDLLCGKLFQGISEKRIRNVYLSRLALCMLEGKLTSPFTESPTEGPLVDVFATNTTALPDGDLDESSPQDDSYVSMDGKTYLATKVLGNGDGAMAYLAVTLADGGPEWFPQKGAARFEAEMAEQFQYGMGNLSRPDLETVLQSRKITETKERMLASYKTLLSNINAQINNKPGIAPSENLKNLLKWVKKHFQRKQLEMHPKDRIPERELYFIMLEVLAQKVRNRMDKIEKAQVVQDEDLDLSLLLEEHVKDAHGGLDWMDGIDQELTPLDLLVLTYMYPPDLLDEFFQLILLEKMSIVKRVKYRHESMVTQMNRELRLEKEQRERKCDDLLDTIATYKDVFEKLNDNTPVGAQALEEVVAQFRAGHETLRELKEEGRKLTLEATDWSKRMKVYESIQR